MLKKDTRKDLKENFFVGSKEVFLNYTFHPLYVQLPNLRSHFWSSNGNHVMSILQVLLKMPGGT